LADARTSLQKTLKYDSKKAMKSRAVPKADQVARLLYNAGLTSYRAGNYNEAYRSFRGSYQSYGIIVGYGAAEGRDTSTYYFASICADLAGNKDTAETMYRNLIAWNYDEPGIYGNLAKLYLAQDKLEEAERVFAEGRSKFPGNQELLIDELNYFLGQGRAPEAIDKFELAIANDPNNPELYFAMGTAFQALIKLDSANAQQHMADARKAYGKSIELNPKSFDAYLNTGALFYNEGVLIQQKLDAVDINDLAAAKALENERNKLYGEALPFFQQAARVYEEMPEEEKIDLFFAIEVYRSLKEINVRLGDYEASGKAKKRMEELQAQRDAAGE
jgi:tetratricopeptide (TPR) repeat protein